MSTDARNLRIDRLHQDLANLAKIDQGPSSPWVQQTPTIARIEAAIKVLQEGLERDQAAYREARGHAPDPETLQSDAQLEGQAASTSWYAYALAQSLTKLGTAYERAIAENRNTDEIQARMKRLPKELADSAEQLMPDGYIASHNEKIMGSATKGYVSGIEIARRQATAIVEQVVDALEAGSTTIEALRPFQSASVVPPVIERPLNTFADVDNGRNRIARLQSDLQKLQSTWTLFAKSASGDARLRELGVDPDGDPLDLARELEPATEEPKFDVERYRVPDELMRPGFALEGKDLDRPVFDRGLEFGP